MKMRKCYILFLLILTAVVFITHGAAQDTADNTTETALPADYFEQVTLFSGGRITRFTQMPIRVHISPTLKALPYLAEIRYALRTWETATDGKIRFQETETLEQADIRVTSTYTGRLSFLDTQLGSAELTRLEQGTYTVSGTNAQAQSKNADQSSNTAVDFTVEVILVLESDGTTGELSQEKMRTVCLHEFGHAIGLWGHSPSNDDVCHAMATAQHPTPRDINTLLKIYNTPLHTPQHDKALDIAPDDAETRKNLVLSYSNHGVTLRNKGEWDAAIRAYRDALALQPTYQLAKTNLIDVLWQKANARRQAGRSAEAIATYLELQKLHPNDTDIASLLGELYLKVRDYPAAVSAFHKVYTAQPTNDQAQHNLIAAYQQYAGALRNQRDYSAALVQLQKAVDLFPTNINLRLSLAQAYQHTGKYEQAKTELEQILAQDPENKNAKTELVNLQVRRGNALMNRKKYAAAVAVFEGIPASAKTIDVHNMIGYLYLVQGEHLKALATFETVLAKRPKNAVAYQNLLSLESQLDVMLSKARAAASTVPGTGEAAPNSGTETDTSDPTAEKLTRVQCALVRCLMNRKEPKNAMEKYQQALGVKPYAPKSRDLLIETGKQLANWFQKRNDIDSHEAIVRWATELDSNFKESLEP